MTQPVIHNNTPLTLDAIRQLPYIGKAVSEWRQRSVDLYQNGTDCIISVGTNFDNSMIVIAADAPEVWSHALDAIADGRVYTYI
jgi:hypothetical protein